jgi:RNA polymerase sigma-70 factor (ECF subfamily)
LALRQDGLPSLCDDVDLDRDRALVERCQAGDSAAFGNLYARYYERLLRLCLRRLDDRHEAEDAAQEAFARAWKALPRFAGERRFYPWLTVIAGNICTDMLRQRSRSTPTDDLELTAHRPVGVVGDGTSEELVLAAVDGELVNRALGRLSPRHRQVLAMREGSGWTYQEIADHEGVEIGIIESLLWRARQALKREFAAVSESKEALAGFLIATGALIRRTVLRLAHRSATAQSQSSGGTGGALRNAFTGAAVAGAAVAAAFIAPHALSVSGGSGSEGGSSATLADPPLTPFAVPVSPSSTVAAATTNAAQQSSSTDNSGGRRSGSSPAGLAGGGITGGSGGGGTTSSGLLGALHGLSGGNSPVSGTLNQAGQGINQTVNSVTNGVGSTVNGLTGGLANTVSGLTGGLGNEVSNTTSNVTSGLSNTAGRVVGGLSSTVPGLLGGGSASGSTPPAASTTTTTTPGLVGGLGNTVTNLLGGN